jgi:hypothetical protein
MIESEEIARLEEIDRLDEELMKSSIEKLHARGRPHIAHEWDRSILPALRASVLRSGVAAVQYRSIWRRAWNVTLELFHALHYNAEFVAKGGEPQFFWCHQNLELFRLQYLLRGICIDKNSLLRTAAIYLSYPEIRTNWLDWMFLDAIVFTELDGYSRHVFETKGGTGTNWAAIFANSNQAKYYRLKITFSLFGFALNFVVCPAVAYYLFTGGHETWALTIGGLWVLFLAVQFLTYPFRWRARRKAANQLQYLRDLYRMLGELTISPRKLKETLDSAAAAGVVLDGAVFSIVDRIIAKDVTTFIPTEY